MKKSLLICLIVSAVFLLLVAGMVLHSRSFPEKNSSGSYTRQFPVMGTLGEITLFDMDRESAVSLMDEAQEKIYQVEKLCSIFKKDSPLSRINASAAEKPVPCPEELFTLLEKCAFYYRISSGAFDVTVRPLMILWGFYRKRNTLPDPQQIRQALSITGFDKVILDRKTKSVSFRKKGVSVDLGGIAKGYALDLAAEHLRKKGVRKFVLNLGGNILCRNENLSDPPFRIGIRHEKDPRSIRKKILLHNGAIATSGDYERFTMINGKRCSHIMDPRTGKFVEGIHSVTVMTRYGIDSDAYSTMIFVLGKKPENLPVGTRVWIYK